MLVGCSPIIKQVQTFSTNNHYHAGFYLYDPLKKEVLADYQGNKYFTPASNTKILTLYTTRLMLPDSLPAFYLTQDSLATYVWPTGNPTFLNPVLKDTSNYQKLAQADSLVLVYNNLDTDRFGPGWAWDDYNTSYSPEKSPFPIYSNFATFTLDSLTNVLSIEPPFLKDSVNIIQGEKFKVVRDEMSNHFTVTIGVCDDCVRNRPFRLTKTMVATLFKDTLHVPVSIIDTLPRPKQFTTLYSMPQDSVIKVMMQESDNFIAEQLLLQASGVLTDTLNTDLAIDSLQQRLQTFLPDMPIWFDGSGLSRYNLNTPRSLVMLWDELLRIYGKEKLMQLISIGGVAGTLKDSYVEKQPYIYGKTGTLSHVHNLSGILIAKSGRLLLFSYMNNHYPISTTLIKHNMEQVLHQIYEKY